MSITFVDTASKLDLEAELAAELTAPEDSLVTCAALQLLLGKLCYARGEFDKARRYLQQILSDAEHLPDRRILSLTYASLGDVYYREGSYSQAMPAYRRAIELGDVESAAPLKGQPDAVFGAFTDSFVPFRRLIDMDPTNVWGYYALGVALERGGKSAEAIAEFEHCAEVDPQFIPGRLQLAALYHEQGNYSGSVSEYRAAIEACEATEELVPDLYLGLGDAYRASGEDDRAIVCYEEAINAIRSARNTSPRASGRS